MRARVAEGSWLVQLLFAAEWNPLQTWQPFTSPLSAPHSSSILSTFIERCAHRQRSGVHHYGCFRVSMWLLQGSPISPASMPETSTVTSAVVKPVLSFQSASYTADGSIIVVLGQTLTFGSLATLVNLATPQAISLFSGGTKAVIGSSTQMLVDIISTEITVQTETAASSVPPPSGSVSPPAGSASPAATITTSTSSQSDPTSNTSGFVGASPTSTELATSNSTASSHHSSPKGISPGASAGIGIGCAAAGALIAAVLIFFILRRRRHNNRHDAGEFSPTDKNPSSFKQAEATTRSLDPGSTSGSSAFALAERDLPLPLEDAAIGGELSRLQTLIKNYAQSYYHTSSVATRNADPSDLGSNLPIPASRLAGMLADPRTRIAAIRFCLMWIITSRNALNSEPNQSLLPLEVINLLRLMPGANEPNCKWLFINIRRL